MSTQRIDLVLRTSRHIEIPMRDGLPVHLHHGTEDAIGRVGVLSGRTIAAGETGFVQIDLDQPIAALNGDRVLVRDHAARTTLAGGRVIDPLAPRRGRRSPARLAMLEAMSSADAAAALKQMAAVGGFVDLARFALVRNLSSGEFDAVMDRTANDLVRVGAGSAAAFAITHQHLAALIDRITATLAAWHNAQPDTLGPTRAALVSQLCAAAPEAALDAALSEVARAGGAVCEVGMWRLPGHRPRLTGPDEKLWARVRALLAEGELRPPRVREIAAWLGLEPTAIERLLRRAERLGRVAKVADNRYFLPETVEQLAIMAADLAARAPEGTFTAAMFNERSGLGRNLTIQILEYLDKIGATRRVGDARVALPTPTSLN